MGNFLPAAQIREEISAIREEARYLGQLIGLDPDSRSKLLEFYASNGYHISYEEELSRTVNVICERAELLSQLFERLTCDPLIWLGDGTTEEVISLLEGLLEKHKNKRSRQQRLA